MSAPAGKIDDMQLTPVTDRTAALALAELLNRAAAEAERELGDAELTPDLGRRLVERSFGAPEFLLLLAEEGSAPAGLCASVPFADPLTGEVLPLIALLFVEPAFRHRGLARALVLEARRQLSRRGFTRVGARAAHNDDARISMGERFGFVRAWELLLHQG